MNTIEVILIITQLIMFLCEVHPVYTCLELLKKIYKEKKTLKSRLIFMVNTCAKLAYGVRLWRIYS